MKHSFLAILLIVLPSAACSGWLDKIGKGVLEELSGDKQNEQEQPSEQPQKKQSKTGLIISGVTEVLAGASEVPYETERVIGESLALEGFGRSPSSSGTFSDTRTPDIRSTTYCPCRS